MAVKINIDKLASEISKDLQVYNKKIQNGINKAAYFAAKDGESMVKETANVLTGKYAKSITIKKNAITFGEESYIVYAKPPHYRLPHLLEYGHALRNGGREVGHTKAYPHWKPAEEQAIRQFERMVEGVIRRE